MSDNTLSSFEESVSNVNVNATTTTTPPMGEYSNKSTINDGILSLSSMSSSILSNKNGLNSGSNGNITDFDSLPNVLNSLSLNEPTSIFNTGTINPSTPPADWNHNLNYNLNSINGIPSHQHTSSNSSSTKDDQNDVHQNLSFSNNINDSANNSFILPENSTNLLQNHQNHSYLFDQSVKNTPSSSYILSPDRNRNQTIFNTPILNETSRRLDYNLTSPNNINQLDESYIDQSTSSASKVLANNLNNESLGMGIQPVINPNNSNQQINSSIFNGYIPNQFSFLPPMNAVNNSTTPLNGLSSNLINSSPSTSNMLPHQLNGFMNSNQMMLPNPIPNYPTNLLNQNYSYDNFNGNVIPENQKQNQSNQLQANDQVLNINHNANPGSNSNNHINNNNQNHNHQSNRNGNGSRNNLGLNSTANVHRKHSSNNRRGEDASRFINATLNDFVNEIYYLCKDQHGCRFLQRQLELHGETAATKIFNEIQLNVIELMIDPFGNYLIQKLLERVNDEQRTTLVENASNQFVRIALDPHGTRALQKLVEYISTETEYQIIIDSLSSYVVLLSRDLNGNHVIQKCLQKLPSKYCNFIFTAACENCVKIAKHRHGCCVLQRCFDHGTPAQCEDLSLKVGENAVELSIDPYGNYVVQYVLSMEENRLRIKNDPQSVNKIPDTSKSIYFIINSLASNITKLSTHKFGSNVIEKSLRIPTLAPILIKDLLNSPENLKLLLHDAYGNYVLQTSLDVADDSSFKELSELLKPYLNDVRNTPHGRRILSKLISRGGNASIYNVSNISSINNEEMEEHNNNINDNFNNETQNGYYNGSNFKDRTNSNNQFGNGTNNRRHNNASNYNNYNSDYNSNNNYINKNKQKLNY